MTTQSELKELKAAVRNFQRVDIVLSKFTIDELAEVVDHANHLLMGRPMTWIAGVVAKEIDRREREGAEPGMVRFPVNAFSAPELCRFNHMLRIWLRRETNPNIQNFLNQCFEIAMCNLTGRFQALHEASGQ